MTSGSRDYKSNLRPQGPELTGSLRRDLRVPILFKTYKRSQGPQKRSNPAILTRSDHYKARRFLSTPRIPESFDNHLMPKKAQNSTRGYRAIRSTLNSPTLRRSSKQPIILRKKRRANRSRRSQKEKNASPKRKHFKRP